jgi:hypothetical protein
MSCPHVAPSEIPFAKGKRALFTDTLRVAFDYSLMKARALLAFIGMTS